jgi:hypothetical protein
VGEWAEFTWKFLGLGNTTCTVDGRPVSNEPATGQCRSPLRFKVPDGARHQLVVTFRDVCGSTRRSAMSFSVAEGWSTDAMNDPGGVGAGMTSAPDAIMPPPQRPPPQRLAGARSGAAAGRSRSGAGALAAAAAALAAAALLL